MGWCHCSICRRTTGAPAMVWVTVERRALTIEGTPRVYRSSSRAERWFCGECGAQMAFAPDGKPTVDLMIGCFDQPERFAPGEHSFFCEHIGWFDPADGLPRREGD
ncbi:MAG: GFA family protein [Hyphomicrobiaceae bacterium]|nr:GFA family protein [Hyphomicrobiaceae bacterium]